MAAAVFQVFWPRQNENIELSMQWQQFIIRESLISREANRASGIDVLRYLKKVILPKIIQIIQVIDLKLSKYEKLSKIRVRFNAR